MGSGREGKREGGRYLRGGVDSVSDACCDGCHYEPVAPVTPGGCGRRVGPWRVRAVAVVVVVVVAWWRYLLLLWGIWVVWS